ncbi:MAG: hypothetical protein BECKG1743D_GA0114223_101367 [Candidatus Kentron sp. G]|nr:MAG: hypothetical protein BECKG1743F_GA0114225_101147 [Candidatus Kentron sp. G]VFM96889.1 MAG: hypothetical protein BECKG1743E_GA0114224_100968 [Candidatus Kentron sp. G]VFM99652.1 MAG: hypothetical protein BECKG1743D_GA0114223_101367 [Candidatus Kentron sp. G]
MQTESEIWRQVTGMMGDHRKTLLGRHWTFNLLTDPKRLTVRAIPL